MIYTITLNPALDRTLCVKKIRFDDPNRIESEQRYAGGKGIDVSRVLTTLGMTNITLGFIGGFTGEELEGRLVNEGITCDFIKISGETRTNIVILEESTGRQVLFSDKGPEIKPYELMQIIHKVESLNLKTADILESEDTKTGDPRHVYSNGPIREILERVGKVSPISHNHGFTYHAKPLKSIKTALANALEETGIKNFRFHDLRHIWTTNARRAGFDRTVIMKLTGHRTLSMFTRYNSVDEDDAKQALKMMDRYFTEAKLRETSARPLQEQKGGQEESPNPLKSLAPRVGLPSTNSGHAHL